MTRAVGGAGQNSNTGSANTGNGGDGATDALAGNTGGSGVVILKYPDIYTISNPGGGLTYSTSTAGGFTVATFTAGTGNVSWS